jgi:hypothetical protein
MALPKVYIDTNVFKFAATQLQRMVPRRQTLNWGGQVHEVVVHDLVDLNPNENITNPDLKAEAVLLPRLADLAATNQVEYVIQTETLFESWGLPNMDSSTGKFYGAPYKVVEAPITYSRILIGGHEDSAEMQFNFLKSIRAERFLELQRITGAYQGEGELNRNQLLDAFHLWCAEHKKCDYFLTLDFKLIRVLGNNRNKQLPVRAVRPSELLTALISGT